MIYVAKLSYRDSGGTARTAYYTDGQGWTTRSTDTPASTRIEGRLVNAGAVSRMMFRGGGATGVVEGAFGAAEFENGDGALAPWREYFVAGGAYEVYALIEEAEASGTWSLVLKVRMVAVRFSGSRMLISLRDRTAALDVPLAKNFFAGTGNLEGESFVANVRKPWGVGDCYNIAPVLINDDAANSIYVAHDGAFDSATIGRYEKVAGTILTREANYTSQAQLFSTAPSSGATRRWPTGGAFRLGNQWSYEVTADISFGGTTDKLVHRCLEACALRAGLVAGDISASDLSTLDASPTINAGYYVTDDETARSVMNKLAAGGGVWFGFDRSDVLRFGKVELASGSPAVAFTEFNTLGIDREDVPGLTVPVWSVTLRWKRRWRNNRGQNLAWSGLVIDADLGREWDEYTVTDATTLTNNPHARALVIDSYSLNLDSVAAPSTEASRLLTLFKALRAVYRVRAEITTTTLALDIGSAASITADWLGLSSATTFKVIGVDLDFGAGVAEFLLWG